MELKKKTYVHNFEKDDYEYFVLSGDIGGTHSNLAVSGIIDEKPSMIFSSHIRSEEAGNADGLVEFINETLKYAYEVYQIEVEDACLALAGPISMNHESCYLINAKFEVDSHHILSGTLLKSIILINDFEAISYAINLLDLDNPDEIMQLRHFDVPRDQSRLALGAGTGFGKSIMVYDEILNTYIPAPCEAGHTDFPVHDEEELELLNFVKKNSKYPVTYEDFLSGRGIVNIYDYLISKGEHTDHEDEIEKSDKKDVIISRYRKFCPLCKKVFKIFVKFYARAVKNFALGDLTRGGVFIAGGIAAKNRDIFKSKDFLDEIENNSAYVDILKHIPIYVLVDYDISLVGSAYAAMKRKDIAVKK